MTPEEILKRLDDSGPLLIDPADLDRFLAGAEILDEQDTMMNGPIRVLARDGRIVVQESSDKGEIFLHRAAGEEEAAAFLRERMETYERMWDGCGCRIDFRKGPPSRRGKG